MTTSPFNTASLTASSIQEVVEQVFRNRFLSLGQENLINDLLFQHRYSEIDLEMLDQLSLALLNHEISVESVAPPRARMSSTGFANAQPAHRATA
ncbi:hypothetical protein [Thermostichus vulcanus]|uniref:hypothetical protein n=1 Tax=Thermostichus vulcanus TaxID=32053 RepID=UPI001FCB2DB4|nr:hypothetical protein [Thermostichus vulcanus]